MDDIQRGLPGEEYPAARPSDAAPADGPNDLTEMATCDLSPSIVSYHGNSRDSIHSPVIDKPVNTQPPCHSTNETQTSSRDSPDPPLPNPRKRTRQIETNSDLSEANHVPAKHPRKDSFDSSDEISSCSSASQSFISDTVMNSLSRLELYQAYRYLYESFEGPYYRCLTEEPDELSDIKSIHPDEGLESKEKADNTFHRYYPLDDSWSRWGANPKYPLISSDMRLLPPHGTEADLLARSNSPPPR
jgi:hypothetical protein